LAYTGTNCVAFWQRSTITEHIANVFKEGELDEKVVCRDFRLISLHGAIEGKIQEKNVKHYNLDVIISVGDRFKSGNTMNYFNELHRLQNGFY